MHLYIARHAWAGHFGDPGWPDDSLRELTTEGMQRYVQVVQTLSERGFAPQVIATSPYVRCRQTAGIIAEHTSLQPEVHEIEALAPGSDFAALLNWTAAQSEEDLCWVGHNPDVEWLLAAMIGDRDAAIRFAKGSIAAVRFEDQIAEGAGELLWHVTAKSLGL